LLAITESSKVCCFRVGIAFALQPFMTTRRTSVTRSRGRRVQSPAAALSLTLTLPGDEGGLTPSLRSVLSAVFSRPRLELATLNLSLHGKMMLDRIVSGLRWPVETVPSEVEWMRIVRELADAHSQHSIADWKDKPETYHRAAPPLVPSARRTVSWRGINCERLSFDSGYEPPSDEPGVERWLGYENNRTAHAWVLRHRGRPRPWLVCVHGYGCGTQSLDFAAFRVEWLYRTLGLNVALPVLPLHGPRAHWWRSGQGFFGGDVLDTLHAEAQAVWDVRRLLSWIRKQGAPPVGLYGLSLGGYSASVVAALESDLSCVIAGIPATDFIRLGLMHNSPSYLRLADKCGLDWETIKSLYTVISPLHLKPLIPKARRFIFAGRGDCIVPAEHVHDLWEHWEHPEINWYDGSHLSFFWESSVTPFVHSALEATLLNGAGRVGAGEAALQSLASE